jgi:glycine cleavage system transcriptional repressor
MARLGGEFAILMLVSMPSEEFPRLEKDLETLAARGYKLTLTPARHTYAEGHAGWLPHKIEVRGADHEGIIHEVARYLSKHGINIEAADSESTPAPTSGAPLFAMSARVIVPPGLSDQSWVAGLEDIGDRMNCDITVSALQDQ